jgi:Uma2 family endonuclease
MGVPATRYRHTMADYLAIEESSSIRHEFADGEVVAMAGGTPEHAALSAAVVTLLGGQLRGKPCRVYSADLRLRVLSTGLATYADATVVCGAPALDPESPTHVTNPRLVVEVLSPSTEAYDRGEKREHYLKMAELQDYVLVTPDRARVEVWSRAGTEFTHRVLAAADVLELPAIGCSLSVKELYELAGVGTGA